MNAGTQRKFVISVAKFYPVVTNSRITFEHTQTISPFIVIPVAKDFYDQKDFVCTIGFIQESAHMCASSVGKHIPGKISSPDMLLFIQVRGHLCVSTVGNHLHEKIRCSDMK